MNIFLIISAVVGFFAALTYTCYWFHEAGMETATQTAYEIYQDSLKDQRKQYWLEGCHFGLLQHERVMEQALELQAAEHLASLPAYRIENIDYEIIKLRSSKIVMNDFAPPPTVIRRNLAMELAEGIGKHMRIETTKPPFGPDGDHTQYEAEVWVVG